MMFPGECAFEEFELKRMTSALHMLCDKHGVTDKVDDAPRREKLAKLIFAVALKHGADSAESLYQASLLVDQPYEQRLEYAS